MAIKFPYGDAFLVNTPSLSRLSANMYAEHRFREQHALQEKQAIDKEFEKQLGNVPTPDLPEFVNSWNNYKQLKQKALFDKDVQKDPIKLAEVQRNANEAHANAYGIVNDGKLRAQFFKETAKNKLDKPWDYDPNKKLEDEIKTPTSQLIKQGKLNPDYWRDLSGNVDPSKVFPTHKTSVLSLQGDDILEGKSKVGYKQQDYDIPMLPQVYAAELRQKAATNQGYASLMRDVSKVPPEHFDAIVNAYNGMTDDDLRKRGLTKETANLHYDLNNPIDRAIAYKAMEYTVAHQPELKKESDVYNPIAKMRMQSDLTLRNQKTMAGINHGFQEYLKRNVPTWKENQETREDAGNANALFSQVTSNFKVPVPFTPNKPISITDPPIAEKYKDKSMNKFGLSIAPSIEYNPISNKMSLVYRAKNKTTGEWEEDRKEYDPKTYLTDKAGVLYGQNKTTSTLKNLITDYYDKNGGNLWKTIRDFNTKQKPTETSSKEKPTITTKHKKGELD